MSKYVLRYVFTGIISLLLNVPAVVAQSNVGRQAVEATVGRPRPVSRGESHLAGRFHPDPSALKVARLHYSGGGDWYWGGSAIPNFLEYVRDETSFPVDTIERQTTIMEADLFKYPFLFATGHGVMEFSVEEKERLRTYLQGGGFLFANDSYGMADSFLGEMRSLFPEREVVELPFDHDIYHCFYDFPTGPPKIHEHDGEPPRGYALILNGRVVIYFLVESDIGDGWEDLQVHNDPPEKRLQAFRMGLNILTYALLY